MDNSLNTVNYSEIKPVKPYLFFIPKSDIGIDEFNNGFKVSELFTSNTVGFVTANDGLNVSFSKLEHQFKINDLLNLEETIWRSKYKRKKDSRDWTYPTAKKDAIENNNDLNIKLFDYRPFDSRFTLYSGRSRGLYSSPQPKIMQHLFASNNLGLTLCKQFKAGDTYQHIFITKKAIESSFVSNKTSEITSILPLYIYPVNNGEQTIGQTAERTPNLNTEIVKQIADKLELSFTNEKETTENTFAPIDILDYIYAVLHSPTYREKYKEFLKIDFPRVPYPKDKETFWQLVKLGGEIRHIHLLESSTVEKYITQYPEDGDNIVTKPKYQDGKVYINDTQYFDNVPETAWCFYIGGYQPAQKWLKDRKERKLEFDDILHYQKIIVALSETDRLMKEIDKIEIE
jgi:predicted helicase